MPRPAVALVLAGPVLVALAASGCTEPSEPFQSPTGFKPVTLPMGANEGSSTLLDLRDHGGGVIEIVDQRIKPGSLYTRRLIFCRNRTAQVLGAGRTPALMNAATGDAAPSPLIPGTNANALAAVACASAAA